MSTITASNFIGDCSGNTITANSVTATTITAQNFVGTISGTATTAASATTAGGLTGSTAIGAIPYQTGISSTPTEFTGAATAGSLLSANNLNVPVWVTQPPGTGYVLSSGAGADGLPGWVNLTTTGSVNTALNVSVSNSSQNSTCYLTFVYGANSSSSIYIDASGLSYNPSTNNLNISGNITAASFNATSDYRIKENVQHLDDTFVVDNLKPITYINKKTGKQDIGLIAHELQEEYPYLVTGEKDDEDYQSVNYNGLIGILINEIKELKKEMKILKEKIVI